jgi:hypothetical protein
MNRLTTDHARLYLVPDGPVDRRLTTGRQPAAPVFACVSKLGGVLAIEIAPVEP